MKKCDLDHLHVPDECSLNPQAIEELKCIISSEPKLREALTRIVNCLETIKAECADMEKGVDWVDWAFINQEIKHSKKVLKEMKKGFVFKDGEVEDINVHELRKALYSILAVCDGHVGTGPLSTIVQIAEEALEKTGGK